ncbi:MAG TPA: chemotaxis protein CheW [Noviherbaspirillum sp.]
MKANHKGESTSGVAVARQDFLVFSLGGREYGIALEKVQELCHFNAVTPVANAPAIVAGTITLRSLRIPVVDLHRVLDPEIPENGRLTDVVILSSGDRISGIAVDCVIDVISLLPGQVGNVSDEDTVSMAVVGKRSIVLLDADKLMTDFQPGPTERLAA